MTHTTPTSQLNHDLRSLKAGYGPLRQIALRKANLVHATGSRANRTTSPVPMNLGAWQLMQDIDQLVHAIARALRLHPHHAMDTIDLLAGIIRNQGGLAARADYPALVELVHQAAQRLDQTLNPPPGTKMIGWCTQCGSELRCDELELASGYKACDQCRAELKIKNVQRASMARLAVGGTRGTAAEIVRWLTPWGIDIKRNTISQWAKRDRIQPVGIDPDTGNPIYLVWDVWQQIDQRGRHRR